MVMRRVQRRALNVVTNATKHLNAQCETNGTNKSQEGRKLARRDLETQLVTLPQSLIPHGNENEYRGPRVSDRVAAF